MIFSFDSTWSGACLFVCSFKVFAMRRFTLPFLLPSLFLLKF